MYCFKLYQIVAGVDWTFMHSFLTDFIMYFNGQLRLPRLSEQSRVAVCISLYHQVKMNCSHILCIKFVDGVKGIMGTSFLKVRNIFPYLIPDLHISVEIRGWNIISTLELLKQHKVVIPSSLMFWCPWPFKLGRKTWFSQIGLSVSVSGAFMYDFIWFQILRVF